MVSALTGVFIAVCVVLGLVGIGWLAYNRIVTKGRGAAHALNDPFADPYGRTSSKPSRALSWVGDKFRQLTARSSRSAAGAYEGSRRFEDAAWDARVGHPYYEEQELGAVRGGGGGGGPMDTAYEGGGPRPVGDNGGRGRAAAAGAGAGARAPAARAHNPFGDDAEPSNLERGVSGGNAAGLHSPERKSMFREEM